MELRKLIKCLRTTTTIIINNLTITLFNIVGTRTEDILSWPRETRITFHRLPFRFSHCNHVYSFHLERLYPVSPKNIVFPPKFDTLSLSFLWNVKMVWNNSFMKGHRQVDLTFETFRGSIQDCRLLLVLHISCVGHSSTSLRPKYTEYPSVTLPNSRFSCVSLGIPTQTQTETVNDRTLERYRTKKVNILPLLLLWMDDPNNTPHLLSHQHISRITQRV